MPGPAWGQDLRADEVVIAANVAGLLRELAASATARLRPELELVQGWHARVFAGVASVPDPGYLGAFRGSTPALLDYDVVLADASGRTSAAGAPAADVAVQLDAFESALQAAVARLDAVVPAGSAPKDNDELLAVVELAAVVHGEWVRIHPFANGNGRTARIWANWVAMRYGLPPFVRIKPRPDGLLYGQAAHLSMGSGGAPDHELTVQVFLDMLWSRP